MDNERFERACEAAACRVRGGIGTMGEKGIHNALKHYYEPDPSCHEIPVGGYIADIVGEHGVIEIQSASFYRMKEKLCGFLEVTNVTIVYPCVVNKRVLRVDAETGEVLSVRRSPKHRGEYDVFSELRGISALLSNERLAVCVAMLEADEYRPNTQQRGRRRKGGANGVERLPTALLDEIWLESPHDYRRFIPADLPERFTAAQFAQCAGINLRTAYDALYVLRAVGAAQECGKDGRSKLYGVTKT